MEFNPLLTRGVLMLTRGVLMGLHAGF